MNEYDIERIAALLANHWSNDTHIESVAGALPELDLEQAYRVQRRLIELLGTATCGWKIAATNEAGQRHIAVTHPLPGRLLVDRVYDAPASILLRNNRMRVAEGEFAFRIGQDIAPGDGQWDRERVMEHVDGLFPAIEIPDSRFADFASAGAPNLTADNACGREFVLGEAVTGPWRDIALDRFEVKLYKNGQEVVRGTGKDVLGDPRDALAWLVNHCRNHGDTLHAGEFITTGVVGAPVPIDDGDEVIADFGLLGRVVVRFPMIEDAD